MRVSAEFLILLADLRQRGDNGFQLGGNCYYARDGRPED